jgi:hypothetical protein
MKKSTVFILILIVIIIGVVYSATKKKMLPLTVVPEAIEPGETIPASESKEVCYYKETKGESTSDFAFTSVMYDPGSKVHGIINWIPGEKDSLVGTYTGTVEADKGGQQKLDIIYAGIGEGHLSRQQEILLVGKNDIQTGIGEMYLDADGVYKIKDQKNLTYDNSLPMVDCATVPERIKKDYSSTANN